MIKMIDKTEHTCSSAVVAWGIAIGAMGLKRLIYRKFISYNGCPQNFLELLTSLLNA
jgi:hypothetical protein